MRDLCTGSQTVGPFFLIGLDHLCSKPDSQPAPGALAIQGRVLDGAGNRVPDAMLELWCADRDGKYSGNSLEATSMPTYPPGFARVPTNTQGCFTFNLVKPGVTAAGGGRMQAPHVVVLVFARGLLRHLITRMYFPGEPENDSDPVLRSIPAERRSTLIAKKNLTDPNLLEWNIRLQGGEETVFFAW